MAEKRPSSPGSQQGDPPLLDDQGFQKVQKNGKKALNTVIDLPTLSTPPAPTMTTQALPRFKATSQEHQTSPKPLSPNLSGVSSARGLGITGESARLSMSVESAARSMRPTFASTNSRQKATLLPDAQTAISLIMHGSRGACQTGKNLEDEGHFPHRQQDLENDNHRPQERPPCQPRIDPRTNRPPPPQAPQTFPCRTPQTSSLYPKPLILSFPPTSNSQTPSTPPTPKDIPSTPQSIPPTHQVIPTSLRIADDVDLLLVLKQELRQNNQNNQLKICRSRQSQKLPLCFLNTYGGGVGGVVSNFALLDQIAALNWVAENIAQFNGDPARVTLFGRDTGAACISYLMESPIVPPGLFQRVVLMSGWSGCPWSQVPAPLSITLRLAVAAGCPVPDDPSATHPRTVACLRAAPLEALMSAAREVETAAFMPAWGPSEDGVVVSKGRRGSSLSRQPVEVVIGYTPWEAWSWLGEGLISNGVDDRTFERVARTWVRNTRHHHLREVLAAALQEYTDWTAVTPGPLARRDLLLHLLGDAGVIAPLHQAADALARHTKVFMFLCDLGNRVPGQIQAPGWELGLIWGTGLSDVTESPGAPSPPIKVPALTQLSEDFITLLTNFAKSGDPNLPRESPSPGFAAVAWPRYIPESRKYLRIGVPPTVGSQYRAHQLALWTWLVPELEAAGKSYPPDPNSWELSTDPNLFYGVVKPPDPWIFLQPNTTTTTTTISSVATTPITPSPKPTKPTVTTTLALSPTVTSISPKMMLPDTDEYVRYSTALLVTVGLGVSLLLLNGLIFLLLFWRRPSHTCQGHHPQSQDGGGLPRVGSIISVGGLGGTYGGPPDCVKASYEKLHLTPEELQKLTSRSPSSTLKRPKSPGTLKSQGSFKSPHGVATISSCGYRSLTCIQQVCDMYATICRSPRSAGCQRETSFTVQPPSLLREDDSRPRAQSVATIAGQHPATDVYRASSEPRESPLGQKLVGDGNERPNGWATFVGDVPEPPPPPRTSTLRREKKVTILDEAVHRL
ncbi:uncharacterized protein LOC135221374 [Macrobrachium nipponense]|uniref:uncharacterized protein LOC135221374 n=1 Tax=Macrobrachium nipponense TaxID=159736 RepID=UPI0030C8A626